MNETEATVVAEELERLRRENEWYRCAHLLIAQHDAFVGHPDGSVFWYVEGHVTEEGQAVLALHMGDTFHFACADAEPFAYADAPALLALAVREGWPGLNRWASAKRGGLPVIAPVAARMREFDALKQERDDLRAQLAEYTAREQGTAGLA